MGIIAENFDTIEGDIEVGVERLVGTIKIGGTVYNRYVKVVDFGALPNATTKDVNHGISSIVGFLSMKGTAVTGSTFVPIPRISSYTIDIYCTDSKIKITTNYDYSSFTALVTLEYYK